MVLDSMVTVDPATFRLATPASLVWITSPLATANEAVVNCAPLRYTEPVPLSTPVSPCAKAVQVSTRIRKRLVSLQITRLNSLKRSALGSRRSAKPQADGANRPSKAYCYFAAHSSKVNCAFHRWNPSSNHYRQRSTTCHHTRRSHSSKFNFAH